MLAIAAVKIFWKEQNHGSTPLRREAFIVGGEWRRNCSGDLLNICRIFHWGTWPQGLCSSKHPLERVTTLAGTRTKTVGGSQALSRGAPWLDTGNRFAVASSKICEGSSTGLRILVRLWRRNLMAIGIHLFKHCGSPFLGAKK